MNITKTTKTLAVTLAIGMAMHTAASEQGLVAHFTFDDAAHWGFDSVRQAEIGTVYSTVVSGFSEPVGYPTSCAAPIVRGLATATGWWQNNYMEVPGASFGSAYGIPYGSQAVTYSLWIKPSPGWQTWDSYGIGTLSFVLRHGSPTYEWYGDEYSHKNIYIRKDGTTGNPKIAFGVGAYDAPETSALYEVPSLFDGNWHFIAATHANRTLALYYDGQKVAETLLPKDITMGDDRPLLFGDYCENGDNYLLKRYAGSVDDIKVYNRALDASEILAAYNAGAVAFDSDVLVWRGASAGGAVENLGNWGATSNRRTANDIYADGSVMDVTAVTDGGTVTHNANATLSLRGAICSNGQDEVTLRMQSGALAMKRPSTQRGLVAHLSFDDADELTYDSGTAGLTATTDVTTYNGSTAVPIRSTDGVSGKAMYFPGNGEWLYYASPYLKTDSAATTKANGIPYGDQTVSYSLWIKPLDGGRWDNGMYGLSTDYVWLFRRGTWGNGGASYLWLSKGANDGKLWWSIANYCDGDGTCTYEPSNLFDGGWHHVVCVYDNKTLTLYYDGAQVATTTATYSLNVADGASISLGFSGAANEYTRRYLGGFDEFKIFNVALTAQEVAAEYAQGSRTLDTSSPGTVPSPVRIQLDAGISAEVRGYGNEYGTLAGAGSVAVKPGSVLTLDGNFALAGELTGGGAVEVANLTLGGDTDAFTGDFTIRENARIEVSDANGILQNAVFGGKVILPANAVIVWDNGSQAGIATITAASFELPADFSGWKDENGNDMNCKVVNGVLRIRKKIGTTILFK